MRYTQDTPGLDGSALTADCLWSQDQFDAFATYLVAVCEHFHTHWNVTFDTVTDLSHSPPDPHANATHTSPNPHLLRT